MLNDKVTNLIINTVQDITKLKCGIVGYNPTNHSIEFSTFAGLDKANEVGRALIAKGLQHTAGDGIPEFYVSGSEGAMQQAIRWPVDLNKPLINET